MIDIPTAVTKDEASFLACVASGKVVYEAGSLLGYSTVALARSAVKVVSVDPHSGYPRSSPSPTWDLFRYNLRRHGVTNILPVRDIFQNVPVVGEFAFADLTGDYALTKRFLEHSRNCRAVAIHDYARNGCHGATEAVDEWVRLHKIEVHRVGTTVLLRNSGGSNE